jgi:hypothetical protein
MVTKHIISYIFLGDFWKNSIFSELYVNKYGKLRVYGAVFVYKAWLGGLYDSQATNTTNTVGVHQRAGRSCIEFSLSLLVAWETYMYVHMTPSHWVTHVYIATQIRVNGVAYFSIIHIYSKTTFQV